MKTPQETEAVSGMGRHIVDRHTHYELHVNVGPYPATIEIPGYVADAFRERHGRAITESDMLTFAVSFLREDELVKECRNLYRSGSHRKAVVTDLNQVSVGKI